MFNVPQQVIIGQTTITQAGYITAQYNTVQNCKSTKIISLSNKWTHLNNNKPYMNAQ